MCFQVKSCCYCISLEVGTQVIGIGNTILSACVSALYGSAAALLPHEYDSKRPINCVVAAFSAVHCLLSCMLIYGAFRRRSQLIHLWVVGASVLSALLMALSILLASTLLYLGGGPNDINVVITMYFCCSLLLFYCVGVVDNWRAQLSRPEFYPGTLMQPAAHHAFTYV